MTSKRIENATELAGTTLVNFGTLVAFNCTIMYALEVLVFSGPNCFCVGAQRIEIVIELASTTVVHFGILVGCNCTVLVVMLRYTTTSFSLRHVQIQLDCMQLFALFDVYFIQCALVACCHI